jgi:hypothetical protein
VLSESRRFFNRKRRKEGIPYRSGFEYLVYVLVSCQIPIKGNKYLIKFFLQGEVNPRDDFKIRGRYLADKYDYDVTEAR